MVTTRRVDPVPISRLRSELEPLLAAGGFQPLAPKSEWTGKYNIFTWVRRTWKEDALRLGWRKSPVPHYFLDAQSSSTSGRMRNRTRLAIAAVFAPLMLGSMACSKSPSAPTLPTAPAPGPWTLLSTQSLTNRLRALYARPHAAMLELRVEANVEWRVDGVTNSGSDFWLFLDTDRDRRTGCSPNGWFSGINFPRALDLGADFMVAVGSSWGRALYRCESDRWVIEPTSVRVDLHEGERWFEVAVPLDSIGRPAALDLAAACLIGIGAWEDQIPASGRVTFAPDGR